MFPYSHRKRITVNAKLSPFPIWSLKTMLSPRPVPRRLLLVFSWICVVAASALLADESKPPRDTYPTPGYPSNPKVDVRFNRYHDYSQATDLLKNLAEAYPDYCKLASLGKSFGGREMWIVTVTDFSTGDDRSKPAFWIDGGIHANEIQAVEVPLYTAWYLLEMRADSEKIQRLLKERTFYLVPMMSPDSRDAHFKQPNSTHSPRSGQRQFDDDHDGMVNEDDDEDIDGDGHITQMRVRDPNGRFKAHPDFPELMIAAKPDEKGEFTLLGMEGIDNDDDGEINEDGDGYYDPNRDWGWGWRPPYSQFGAHRYPFSILENRLVSEFLMDHPNVAGGQSYHNAGGMILRGPGDKKDGYHPADIAVYDVIGKEGESMLPGYRYINVAFDLYEVRGGSIDWMHQSLGIFTFTNELFTPFNFFRKPEGGGFFGGAEAQHAFNKKLLLGDGFSPWKEFQHPQLGRIEVGGMKKSWVRQPPSFLLEEECHRNMCFTLYHADEMPQARIQSIAVKPLANNLFEVTCIAENRKVTPTRSMADVERKISPSDTLSLKATGAKVITGMHASDLLFREPQAQKRNPERLDISRIPGRGVVYARWIVQGAGPFEVELVTTKGGRDTRREELR